MIAPPTKMAIPRMKSSRLDGREAIGPDALVSGWTIVVPSVVCDRADEPKARRGARGDRRSRPSLYQAAVPASFLSFLLALAP